MEDRDSGRKGSRSISVPWNFFRGGKDKEVETGKEDHSEKLVHAQSATSPKNRESFTEQIAHAGKASEFRMETLQKVLDDEENPGSLFWQLCDRRSETGYWVDSNQFRVIICAVVLVNAGYAGISAIDESDSLGTFIFEVMFLIVFSWELALRLVARGLCEFFRDRWSYFDVILVVGNAAEVITTLIQFAVEGGLSTATAALRVLRVLRLMRVLQVVRLFRFVDELQLLLKGMFAALRTLVWSMLMLSIVVYICSLLCTTYIGQPSQNEMTKYYFGNLGRSMFTLFTFVTLEQWPEVARHLMDTEEFGGFIVMVITIYILFTNLALLNLVTAVLIDSVITISNSDDRKRMQRIDKERKDSVRRLERIFKLIDTDGDGELTYEEFIKGMNENKEVRETMRSLQLATTDAQELFHLIDFDDDGFITPMEFIEGAIMCKAGDEVSRKLLSFHYDMRKYFQVMGHAQDSMMEMMRKTGAGSDSETEFTKFQLPRPKVHCDEAAPAAKRLTFSIPLGAGLLYNSQAQAQADADVKSQAVDTGAAGSTSARSMRRLARKASKEKKLVRAGSTVSTTEMDEARGLRHATWLASNSGAVSGTSSVDLEKLQACDLLDAKQDERPTKAKSTSLTEPKAEGAMAALESWLAKFAADQRKAQREVERAMKSMEVKVAAALQQSKDLAASIEVDSFQAFSRLESFPESPQAFQPACPQSVSPMELVMYQVPIDSEVAVLPGTIASPGREEGLGEAGRAYSNHLPNQLQGS